MDQLVDNASLRDAPVLPEMVRLPGGGVVHVLGSVKEVLEACEYASKLHKRLRDATCDADRFTELSNTKTTVDLYDELLDNKATALRHAILSEPPVDGREYLWEVLSAAQSVRRWFISLQKFLVLQLNDTMAEEASYAAVEREYLTTQNNPNEQHPTLSNKRHTYPSANSSASRTDGIEGLINNACYQLGRERRRLWQERGIGDDGKQCTEQGTEGGLWRFLKPLKCSCGTAGPGYPTSPLLEQLVADVADLRQKVAKHDPNNSQERLMVSVVDAALCSLDPEKVRDGEELRFFRSELSKLEELILDASGLIGVENPAAVASSRVTLGSVKHALNGHHKLLLSRFQELQEFPTARDYQELFALCEAHLETIQDTERRLP